MQLLARKLIVEKLLPQALTSSEVLCEAARKLLIATSIFPASNGMPPHKKVLAVFATRFYFTADLGKHLQGITSHLLAAGLVEAGI